MVPIKARTAPMEKRLTYNELLKENERLETELNKHKIELQPNPIDSSPSLSELIDIDQLKELMDYFYKITHYAIAIGDVNDTILIGMGWQEICTKYHRVHPATCKNCKISDAYFHQQSSHAPVAYKCQNGLWDIACPIIINGKNVAAIFFGQFFYEDEPIDNHFFEQQAEKYGFDRVDYLKKLKQVPKIPRHKVNNLIHFYAGLAQMIAHIGQQNLKIKQSQQKIIASHQQEIIEQKELLDNIINNLPLGLQIFDKDGFSQRINQMQKNILGLSDKNNGIGQFNILTDAFSKMHGTDKLYQKVYEGEKLIKHEWEYDFSSEKNTRETSKGKRILQETIFPVLNASQEVTHVISLLNDITQKKEIEKAVHESDQRFRSIFENLVSGIAFTSVEGQLLTVNKEFIKITGYSSEELLTMNYKDITHPDDIDTEQEILNGAIASLLHEISYEKRYITKKGETIWVDLSVSFIYDNNTPIYFVGVVNEITEQKRVEQELSHSEERFKKLVENSPDIIYLYSKKRGALYWSPRVRDILGFEPNELMTNPFKWNRAIHPDDLPAVTDAIENDTLGVTIDLEYRVKSLQGKWIWLHDRITSKKVIDGDTVIEGYASDITQRREVELALINSQNKLHSYLDSSPIGIAISKRDHTIQMLNRKFIELFGYTLSDIPTINHWFPLAYPDPQYREAIIRRWSKEVELCTSNHQKFRPLEGEVHCKNGTRRIIEFGFESIGDDQITTFVDVTERKKIELRIRESELQLKKLYNNTPIMMHAINMKGQLISVNQYWLNKLGYLREEVLGRKSTEFLTESSRELANKKIPLLIKKGEIQDLEFKFVKKNGDVIDVMLSAEIQYDENKQPISAFAMLRDVTEQKKAREKIMAQNEQLKALNATKDKFFSIIAHDLRAPFNVILGFSELMVERIQEKRYDEVERFSKLVLHATNHSNNLLSNLLEWSRTQTGRIHISLKKHPIHVIINNVVNFFKAGFDTKHINIQTRFEANLMVLADKHMLETVIRNLISNAIKFTPENGMITITTKTEQNNAKISITDTGIGIEKKELAKLCKIESNYSTPGTNKETGTGLGLILCKEFIEKQGGTISVSSQPGKGSCFSITLPLE